MIVVDWLKDGGDIKRKKKKRKMRMRPYALNAVAALAPLLYKVKNAGQKSVFLSI